MSSAERLEFGRLGESRLAIRHVALSGADLRAIILSPEVTARTMAGGDVRAHCR